MQAESRLSAFTLVITSYSSLRSRRNRKCHYFEHLQRAAEKISDCIAKREDIKQLDVPNDVLDDLNEAYDDCWRDQYNTADSKEEPKTII